MRSQLSRFPEKESPGPLVTGLCLQGTSGTAAPRGLHSRDHDHASATAASVRATGGGISTQSYALRTRILDVDGWVRRSRVRMLEGHPEVSFAAMGGAPLAHSKHSAAGSSG